MKTNIVIDISLRIPCLGKFWFLSYEPKCCQPIKLPVSLKCNISRKKWHAQSIQNIKFAISLPYLKENLKNENDFWNTDKHQSFLQSGTIISVVCGKAYPDYPK